MDLQCMGQVTALVLCVVGVHFLWLVVLEVA